MPIAEVLRLKSNRQILMPSLGAGDFYCLCNIQSLPGNRAVVHDGPRRLIVLKTGIVDRKMVVDGFSQ